MDYIRDRMKNFTKNFINEFSKTLSNINLDSIEIAVKILKNLKKQKGRLFLIGIGGSAGNTSHAVNDFRKLCNIESYSPTDNPSEITARTNDEGFETIFEEYLKISKLSKKDILMVLSVGGGNEKKNVSVNLIKAIKYSKKVGAKSISIVGKKDGYAFKNTSCSILVNPDDNSLVTPISETMQTLVWHLLVSHPQLKSNPTKW